MKILIVDDSNDKIASIVKTVNEVADVKFEIDTVIDLVGALSKVKEQTYDLMIVDLLLPIRPEDEPIENGGNQLLQEIERKCSHNIPRYIVGLTQHSELISDFSEMWKALHYSQETNWKSILKKLVNHIRKSSKNGEAERELKPVLYVEGRTDKAILIDAIRAFGSELESKVDIKTVKGAGAKWVGNQVVAWAHQLQRREDGSYEK